mgnify:FL=1
MKNLNEQINNITVPMSQVPEEIKQQWIQDYYEPEVNCDTNCLDCKSYYICESSFKLDEQTRDFWLNERDYEPPYREPFSNDDCDGPDFSNYEQEEEPDYY